jgi:hypothetical protein
VLGGKIVKGWLKYDAQGVLFIASVFTVHEIVEGESIQTQIAEEWLEGYAHKTNTGEWVLLLKKDNTQIPLKPERQVKFHLSERDLFIHDGRFKYNREGNLIIQSTLVDHEVVESESLELEVGKDWLEGYAHKTNTGEWVLLLKKDNTQIPIKLRQDVKFQLNDRDFFSYELELQLGLLAMEWRSTHRKGLLEEAEKVVEKYWLVVEKLWEIGWRGSGLLPDSELPDELMPQYFLEYWKN